MEGPRKRLPRDEVPILLPRCDLGRWLSIPELWLPHLNNRENERTPLSECDNHIQPRTQMAQRGARHSSLEQF